MSKIFIDIGHGGKDPGAINKPTGTTEKAINLNVGLKLKDILTQKGFRVMCSRYFDTFLDLTPRCNMANEFKADLFISVHHNAGGGDGYEAIHSIHHGVGTTIARLVAEEFKNIGQNVHGQGVYSKASQKNPNTDFYAVIRQTNMPAIITEFAYMDSRDFEGIDTLEEQYKEAEAIARAVCRYFSVQFEEKRMEESKMHWAQELLNKAKAKGLITGDHDLDKPLTLGELLAVMDRLGELD